MDLEFIPETLRADPGSLEFVDIADKLLEQKRVPEALYICLQGLSHNPECHEGRIILAKAFYHAGFVPFAVRELQCLRQSLPEVVSIPKLLEKLSPEMGVDSPEAQPEESEGLSDDQGTLAESEFDFDEIELMDDED